MALGLLGMAGAIGGGIGGGIARVGGSRLAGAAVGSAAGGFAGHQHEKHRRDVKIKQYQGLRNIIKKQTDGLGGLVYDKKNNQFVVTYGGTLEEATKKGHIPTIGGLISVGNDKLDIKLASRVGFMSDKKLTSTIKNAVKTEEGREKLQSYFENSQMGNPYASDYGTRADDKDPFGFGTSMKRFPSAELREREA